MTIGDRIKESRKNKGLKQSELADRIGVSVISIGRYESGERTPTVDIIAKIAEVFGLNISDFLSDVDMLSVDSSLAQKTEKAMQIMVDELPRTKILSAFDKLNLIGKETAVQRVEELTEIERYTRPDEETPQK